MDKDISIFLKKLPNFIEIERVKQISTGSNSLTYRIEVLFSVEPLKRVFCLRLEDVDANQEKNCSMEMEADIIKTAAFNEIPVPKLIAIVNDSALNLGSGHLTEWIEGETVGNKVIKISISLENKNLLATQCGRILAEIHCLDYQNCLKKSTVEALEKRTLSETIHNLSRRYSQLNILRPSIDYILRSCKAIADSLDPYPDNLCLVHGDFRNGNLMVSKRGIVAVLDWELCHLSEPYSDLAWLCVNSWRFTNHEKAVGGFGDKENLIDSYIHNIIRKRQKGFRFDAKRFKAWMIVGSLKWAIIALHMGVSWTNSKGNGTISMERAVIARRATEAELDCLRKIFEYFFPSQHNPVRLPIPSADAFDPKIYNILENLESKKNDTAFVSALELTSGVYQFLYSDLDENMSSRQRYLSRVSISALRIIERSMKFQTFLDKLEKNRLWLLLKSLPNYENSSTNFEEVEIIDLNTYLKVEINSISPSAECMRFFLIGYHLLLTVHGQMKVDQPYYGSLTAAKTRIRLLYAGRKVLSKL